MPFHDTQLIIFCFINKDSNNMITKVYDIKLYNNLKD